jgi:hypothetical protein
MCAQQWLQWLLYADVVIAAAALIGKAIYASQWLWLCPVTGLGGLE